ncbi:anthrone oxygenase family protein [uncultured Kriegella sp.]|uniref:anthrone oxygenase family protein n=1 Tax=uncultured Kriegella sp. TaxID=1798910 RepID=UPI0030D8ECE1|tara:strand:+ start:2886 stop:3371 length:486 start_codon:yes stop_codon:yes gene_type:complete
MKTIIFFITILLTGLSAGLFFAWSISVIVGTQKLGANTYLQTMQSINKEILNPIFFIVFFGSLIALVINAIGHFDNKLHFWLILAAALFYGIGTFGVTVFGNVPLNNQLEALDLGSLSKLELSNFRSLYESQWNHYHNIRTISAMIAFLLLLVTIFFQKTI